MAYKDGKRTVRCKFCWTSGHNISGCPEKKARIEQIRADDPDHYSVRQYDAAQKQRKRRTCSYCSEDGHTLPTCSAKKTDRSKAIKLNEDYRSKCLEYFKNIGLGIGTLVKAQWYWNDVPELCVVVGVDWGNIIFKAFDDKAHRNSFIVKKVIALTSSDSKTMEFPADLAGVATSHSIRTDDSLEVVGAISSNAVAATVPDGWLDGTLGTEAMFLNYRGKKLKRNDWDLNWIREEE